MEFLLNGVRTSELAGGEKSSSRTSPAFATSGPHLRVKIDNNSVLYDRSTIWNNISGRKLVSFRNCGTKEISSDCKTSNLYSGMIQGSNLGRGKSLMASELPRRYLHSAEYYLKRWLSLRLSKNILLSLWNPKVHHRVHKNPPLDPILSQPNAVHPIDP